MTELTKLEQLAVLRAEIEAEQRLAAESLREKVLADTLVGAAEDTLAVCLPDSQTYAMVKNLRDSARLVENYFKPAPVYPDPDPGPDPDPIPPE